MSLFAVDERYSFTEIFNSWTPEGFEHTATEEIVSTDNYTLLSILLPFPEKYKKTCPKCGEDFYESDLNPSNKKGVVYLLSIHETPFHIVITNAHSEESDYVNEFFNKYDPFMSRLLLRASQIKDLLFHTSDQEIYGSELIAYQYILKRYYDGKEIERHYKQRDFKSIIEEAKERNLWLDNITFRTEERSRIQVSRAGTIQYYDNLIFSDMLPVIDYIAQMYSKSYNIVENTNEKHQDGEIAALKITLSHEVFSSKESSQHLIEHIRSYRDSEFTILSVNGPFFEGSLLDSKTGATNDICVYKSNEILLIPQFQNSNLTLMRIANHILEEYDGELN